MTQNISNQAAEAFGALLSAGFIANTPTVNAGISPLTNQESITRVISVCDTNTLYKSSIPGIYSLKGMVYVIRALDETPESETKFHETCVSVESILGSKYNMPSLILALDPGLILYTYEFVGSTIEIGDHQVRAIYNWTAIARNQLNTTN